MLKAALCYAGLSVGFVNSNAIVDPRRKTAVLGANVLEHLDLLVDCTAGRVVPRYPRGKIYEIE